jgi:MFS family permease
MRAGHEVDGNRLPRNVKALSAVSLAQDTGSEMMYPLLPTFVTGTLGAPVVAVGVAEGLADALAASMKLVAGRLADRRRRPWIATGYAIATVGKIVVALALVWPVVIVGRAVDRIGKGIRGVPRDALIADDTPESIRGRAFGFHRSLDTLGAVVGPLVGPLLLQVVDGKVRVALAIAVVPAAVSVALVALVREKATTPGTNTAPIAVGQPADPVDRSLPAGAWRVLAPLIAFSLVNSSDALLLQHACFRRSPMASAGRGWRISRRPPPARGLSACTVRRPGSACLRPAPGAAWPGDKQVLYHCCCREPLPS